LLLLFAATQRVHIQPLTRHRLFAVVFLPARLRAIE